MKDLYKKTWLRYALMGSTVGCGVVAVTALAIGLFKLAIFMVMVAVINILVVRRADKLARGSYVSLKIAKTITPGELADRWAINKVKSLKFQQLARIQSTEEMNEGWEALQFLARHFSERKRQELQVLLDRLYELNLHQWELEDNVRLCRDWKSAVAARDNNTIRIEQKNFINQLFGSKLEHKLYQTQQVESL